MKKFLDRLRSEGFVRAACVLEDNMADIEARRRQPTTINVFMIGDGNTYNQMTDNRSITVGKKAQFSTGAPLLELPRPK